MDKVDKYLMKEVIKYLPNQDVFQLYKTSKYYNDIFDRTYIDFIKYRQHPAVFNMVDNYCTICNMSIIYLLDDNLEFIRCSHI